MHRRLVKSLATMMGAAALLVAPIALVAPAQAAVVAAEQEFLEPDDVVGFSSEANQTPFWVDYLTELGFTNVECTKDDNPGESPYEVPDDQDYLAVIVKGGSDSETANEVYLNPPAGGLIEHAQGLSHVILCTGDEPSSPPPTTTPPTTKPPVVETDRVSETGSANALGILAAGALVAGAGALFLSRRRQGAHR